MTIQDLRYSIVTLGQDLKVEVIRTRSINGNPIHRIFRLDKEIKGLKYGYDCELTTQLKRHDLKSTLVYEGKKSTILNIEKVA